MAFLPQDVVFLRRNDHNRLYQGKKESQNP